MMISTKGKYGLMAMVDMAINSTEEYVPLKSIADRQNISPKYLEQVFSALKKAKLIKSTKGQHGGYAISRKPSTILVGEILRVLEGDLCITKYNNCSNNTIKSCIDMFVWQKVDESINSLVDSITLEQLILQYKIYMFSDKTKYSNG
ncbi:MAG: Rrf2 family transcriptional regulator [Clostridiaceae bacterium]